MIQLRVSGDSFDDIIRFLDATSTPDLMPLAQEIGEIMVEGNRVGLLAGTDLFGDRMADLEESTIERGRGGDGPPLVPRGAGSRAISDFQARYEEIPGGVRIIGEWPGTPFIRFHSDGFVVHTRHGSKAVPPRDPVGIRPGTASLMGEAVDRFAANLLARF